jgi:hypothetical protein
LHIQMDASDTPHSILGMPCSSLKPLMHGSAWMEKDRALEMLPEGSCCRISAGSCNLKLQVWVCCGKGNRAKGLAPR